MVYPVVNTVTIFLVLGLLQTTIGFYFIIHNKFFPLKFNQTINERKIFVYFFSLGKKTNFRNI